MNNVLNQPETNEIETVNEWITLEKLATETGLGVPLLRSLCKRGILPHDQTQGDMIKVSRTEYNEWLMGNRIKTAKKTEKKLSQHLLSQMGYLRWQLRQREGKLSIAN